MSGRFDTDIRPCSISNSKSDLRNSLRLGDALAVLGRMPSNSVELGITSPPYNKQEKQKGWLVKNVVYASFKDKMPEEEYQKNQVATLNQVFRVTKGGGSFFYNHKIRWDNGEMYHPMDWLRKTRWTLKQEITWDRTIAANIRGWRFWQVDERIYWLYKPIDGNKKGAELASKDAKLTSVWRAPPANKNPHPAPFPLWLPARLIIALLGHKERGLVLDPYCGSGTTLVAAKLLGFDYLGIDISREYLAYCKNRLLRTSDRERDEINAERALHRVEKTFKQRKANNENVGKFRRGNAAV